jgi:lysophospholipase L1-like esterase
LTAIRQSSGGNNAASARFQSARGIVGGGAGGKLPNSNETAYTKNARVVATRILTGAPNIAAVGDSLWFPFNTNRLLAACVKILPIPFRGIAIPPIAPGATGIGVRCTAAFVAGGVLEIAPPLGTANWRPGEALPSGDVGFNTTLARVVRFTGDYTNFGSPLQFQTENAERYDQTDANLDVVVGGLFKTSARHVAQWRLRGFGRGSGVTALASTTIANVQGAGPLVYQQTATFSRGSGSSERIIDLQSWNETEGGSLEYCLPMKIDFRYPSKSTGAFWTYFGSGGFTTQSHLDSGESLNLDGAGSFLVRYSDNAVVAEAQAYGLDTFVIQLGQNNSSNEWNGTTIGSYAQNMTGVINRLVAASLAAGRDPLVLLVSTYDTASGAASKRFSDMEEALSSLAEGRVGLIKLRKKVFDTLGDYSAWQAVQLADGVHPSATGSTTFGTYIRDMLLEAAS